MSRPPHFAPPAALTDTETRAGLRAVRRVLDVARDHARTDAGPDKLADILDSAGRLPELLARPDLFRNWFRPTLEELAGRHDELTAVLSEFDRATRPPARPRRRVSNPHADLWFDCGAGD